MVCWTKGGFLKLLLAVAAAGTSKNQEYGDEVCEAENCRQYDNEHLTSSWTPFRIANMDNWIAFSRLAKQYSDWHDRTLQNEDLPCQSKKVVVFTPNAGLGDSVGALTTAYLYTLRAGRLFFIDWRPYPWTIMFKGLPFLYNYRKVLKMTTKAGKPLICPDRKDESSFLHGHVTTGHPLIREAEGWDFHTNHDEIIEYFLQPSAKVEKVMKDILNGPFDETGLRNDQVLHKVALVLRTGIGEYNQFLSPGDEKIFVTCFHNYAEEYQKQMGGKKVRFVVFVTSDITKTKNNVIEALESNPAGLDIKVATLKDSSIHVMHVSKEESKEDHIREKLRKTIAEYFLIGKCDARFLTHGSLFGKSAAERGGGDEELNFFISDSNCDGKREKYSYLKCHQPKYPKICNLS